MDKKKNMITFIVIESLLFTGLNLIFCYFGSSVGVFPKPTWFRALMLVPPLGILWTASHLIIYLIQFTFGIVKQILYDK